MTIIPSSMTDDRAYDITTIMNAPKMQAKGYIFFEPK